LPGAQTLALTPPGTDLVPELAALADRNDAEFFGQLSGTERRTLERLLKRMVEHCRITAVPID
jgi:DNA-binding MarR family transcriptional regulator